MEACCYSEACHAFGTRISRFGYPYLFSVVNWNRTHIILTRVYFVDMRMNKCWGVNGCDTCMSWRAVNRYAEHSVNVLT